MTLLASGKSTAGTMAGATGLEPATFGVTGPKLSPRNQFPFQLPSRSQRAKRRRKLEL